MRLKGIGGRGRGPAGGAAGARHSHSLFHPLSTSDSYLTKMCNVQTTLFALSSSWVRVCCCFATQPLSRDFSSRKNPVKSQCVFVNEDCYCRVFSYSNLPTLCNNLTEFLEKKMVSCNPDNSHKYNTLRTHLGVGGTLCIESGSRGPLSTIFAS